MSEKPLSQWLVIKPGYKVAILGALPGGARIVASAAGDVDVVQVFAKTKVEMESALLLNAKEG